MYLNTSMTEEEDEQLALLYKSRFVFNGCYLVFTAFYLFVLCRRGIHLNLKLLFMHLPLVYVVNSSGQAYIKMFDSGEWRRSEEKVISRVFAAAFGNFFNMDVLVVERIVATVFFASYEKFDSKVSEDGPPAHPHPVRVQWSMSVATFYIAHIPGLYHFIVLPIGAVNTIVVLVVSILLPRVT
ncbi:hypothetical protein M3Y99_01721500 [Aphelenchoides fujianensis]|nr:hypothetical protein M3Y99_01721500 [Aphelenchoides fujianensis]